NTPCQPTDMERCCTVPNGADYTCVKSFMYSQDAATHDSLCTMAGGIPTAGDCSQSGTVCSFIAGFGVVECVINPATADTVTGGSFGYCVFTQAGPPPFTCASQSWCSTEPLIGSTCAGYGGVWEGLWTN